MDIKSDWQRFEFDINGETVAAELHPMKMGAIFALMRVNAEKPDDSQIEVMASIFSDYVRNLENLTVNGQPLKPEEIPQYPQLMGFCGEVMAKLTEISNLVKADEKN